MRERFNAVGYSYAKSYYRNIYDMQTSHGVRGASALGAIKMIRTKGVWDAGDTEYIPASTHEDPEDPEGTISVPATVIPVPDTKEPTLCAVNMANQVHSKVNTHRPSCKFSFICTLAQESDTITMEELELLISHKETVVKRTVKGRRMVQQYHRLGSVLERRMQSDLNRYELYDKLHRVWLNDIVKEVQASNADRAEKLYLDMLKYLCTRYGVVYNVG